MDEYLTTGKASPGSERTEVQCAYEVVGRRQAETGTKKNKVSLELPTLVPTQIISCINSILFTSISETLTYTNTDDEEHDL